MTNTSFCSLWYSVVITKNWKPKLEQHSVYILMEMIWQVINEMTRYFVFCKIPQFSNEINRRKKNKSFHDNEHFFIIKQIINTNIVTFQTIINTFTYKFQIEFYFNNCKPIWLHHKYNKNINNLLQNNINFKNPWPSIEQTIMKNPI